MAHLFGVEGRVLSFFHSFANRPLRPNLPSGRFNKSKKFLG
jgi:hypothetical protein